MSTPSSTRQVWELWCPTVWGRTHLKVLSKGNICLYSNWGTRGPFHFMILLKVFWPPDGKKAKSSLGFLWVRPRCGIICSTHCPGGRLWSYSCSWLQEERRNEVSLCAHETDTKLASDNSPLLLTMSLVHFINFPDPSPKHAFDTVFGFP